MAMLLATKENNRARGVRTKVRFRICHCLADDLTLMKSIRHGRQKTQRWQHSWFKNEDGGDDNWCCVPIEPCMTKVTNILPPSTHPATIMAKKRRRGEVEDLPVQDLPVALQSAITSRGSAELALLFLIDKYDFNLDALKSRLQGSCYFCLIISTKHHRILHYE
jgi:hypothetical protein